MSLKTQIEQDIKQAMLAKNKDELTALRAIKSAILLAATETGTKKELTQADELKLLTKQAKQRKDSAELYEKQGRNDLAQKERQEYEVIARYLPKQLSEDELKATISAVITQVGASNIKDMGKVMGVVTKTLAGKAEGKTISMMVKSLLA